MTRPFKKEEAFTLIELIVVIAILGILVLLAAPKLLGYTQDAKIAQIKNDVKAYENAIEIALIDDESYIDDWGSVTPEELEGYVESSSLFDIGGFVTDTEFTDEYFAVDEELVKTKLDGNFILSRGGKVYYHEEAVKNDMVSYVETLNIKDRDSTVEHSIELDNLTEIESISVDNGQVEILEIHGNTVTFKVSNGDVQGDGSRINENINFTTDFILENLRIYANDLMIDEESVLQKDDELFRYENVDLDRVYTGGPSEYKTWSKKCEGYHAAEVFRNAYEYGERVNTSSSSLCSNVMSLDGTVYSQSARNLIRHWGFDKIDYSEYSKLMNLHSDGFNVAAQKKLNNKDKVDYDDPFYMGDLVRNFDYYSEIDPERVVRLYGYEQRENPIVWDEYLRGVYQGGSVSEIDRDENWTDGKYSAVGLSDIDEFMKNYGVNYETVRVEITVYDKQAEAEILVFEDGMETAEWTYTGTATRVNEYYDYNVTIEYK